MALAATPGGGPLGHIPQQSTAEERTTICISRPTLPDRVLQHGDPGFGDEISRFYSPAESAASEALIQLKSRLRNIKGEDFWTSATEGLAQLLSAQYAFISKR